jgi:hypothetical protein
VEDQADSPSAELGGTASIAYISNPTNLDPRHATDDGSPADSRQRTAD